MKSFDVLFAHRGAFHRTIVGKVVNIKHYSYVATFCFPDEVLNDNCREMIFTHCQNIDNPWRPNAPCRSMSVGDLILNDKGEYWMVDSVGYLRRNPLVGDILDLPAEEDCL